MKLRSPWKIALESMTFHVVFPAQWQKIRLSMPTGVDNKYASTGGILTSSLLISSFRTLFYQFDDFLVLISQSLFLTSNFFLFGLLTSASYF